jgi:hypothetical protein
MSSDRFHDDERVDWHWAASRENCQQIGRRIGKELVDVQGPVDNSPLPFKCVYKGPQTTFSQDDDDE